MTTKPKNTNLGNAKKEKKDEFYTQYPDIESEMSHYKHFFMGKTVYCNCDNPDKSNFWHFFINNFKSLGLKKAISTYFVYDDENAKTYKTEAFLDSGNENLLINKTALEGDGDFRSEECVSFLKEADIIVTNPPFSLFRDFMDVMDKNDKKFLVIGNQNAVTYKDTFPLMMTKGLRFGYGKPTDFRIPKEYIPLQKNAVKLENGDHIVKFGSVVWFTNLKDKNLGKDVVLTERYYRNEDRYPKYDTYEVINVDRSKDIPCDYEGVMGVPITFFDKLNTEQFEIIGMCNDKHHIGDFKCRSIVNGKHLYFRLFIKNKKPIKLN